MLSQKFGEQKITTAVILAGGQGIKLKGKRKLVSKILMPIKRKPLIEYNFDLLRKYGITEVIFAPGRLGKEIKEYIGNGSRFNLEVSYLGQDRGTADSLRLLKNLVNETFLMMNGDILLEVDLEDMLDFHKKCCGLLEYQCPGVLLFPKSIPQDFMRPTSKVLKPRAEWLRCLIT